MTKQWSVYLILKPYLAIPSCTHTFKTIYAHTSSMPTVTTQRITLQHLMCTIWANETGKSIAYMLLVSHYTSAAFRGTGWQLLHTGHSCTHNEIVLEIIST